MLIPWLQAEATGIFVTPESIFVARVTRTLRRVRVTKVDRYPRHIDEVSSLISGYNGFIAVNLPGPFVRHVTLSVPPYVDAHGLTSWVTKSLAEQWHGALSTTELRSGLLSPRDGQIDHTLMVGQVRESNVRSFLEELRLPVTHLLSLPSILPNACLIDPAFASSSFEIHIRESGKRCRISIKNAQVESLKIDDPGVESDLHDVDEYFSMAIFRNELLEHPNIPSSLDIDLCYLPAISLAVTSLFEGLPRIGFLSDSEAEAALVNVEKRHIGRFLSHCAIAATALILIVAMISFVFKSASQPVRENITAMTETSDSLSLLINKHQLTSSAFRRRNQLLHQTVRVTPVLDAIGRELQGRSTLSLLEQNSRTIRLIGHSPDSDEIPALISRLQEQEVLTEIMLIEATNMDDLVEFEVHMRAEPE